MRKSVKLSQFLLRFFSGEYEAASVVAMTSSSHKFHHVGFRHFLMNSFRRLRTTGCFVQDVFKNFTVGKKETNRDSKREYRELWFKAMLEIIVS